MNEIVSPTPDENLQTLLDRYALVDEDFEPSVLGIANAEATHARMIGPRNGKLYGELTRSGLVHVWATHDKQQFAHAQVLIINHDKVTTYTHMLNRQGAEGPQHDWAENAGISYSLRLVDEGRSLRVETLDEVTAGKWGEAEQYAADRYERVVRALAQFVEYPQRNDALHQTHGRRTDKQPDNLAQLYPYAGQAYGPRVNIAEMADAGVDFHPAVAEALETVPGMVVDSER